MFKLIIQDDEGKTTVVPLIRDEITIGRKEGNTIRLTERNVSRKHARLVKNNGGVLIEDLDSYNGVRVNGTRIQGRASIGEADRIQIGDYLLELKLDRASTPPPGGTAAGSNGPVDSDRTLPMERIEAAPAAPAAAAPTAPTVPVKPTLPPDGAPLPIGDADPTQRHEGRHPAGSVPPAPPVPPVAVASDAPARMVCVSNNFPGKEWTLDRPAMVIGRTDDNDIVVNHRSISRHHAKVVREHGRYAIVDLQSSNGVRVNGEDYGKVELRRGDLVDLGHVRLRFVEAGEDFVFQRDATVVDLSSEPSGKSKAPLYAVAGVAVVAVVIAVIVLGKGGSKKIGVAASNGTHGAVAVPADAAPAVVPAGPDTNPPPGNADVEAKLAAAQKALDGEDWSGALAAARDALRLDGANVRAKDIAAKAQKESDAETVFDEVAKLAKAGKVEDAAKAAKKIPDDSVYRAKADAEIAKAAQPWLGEELRAAKQLADAGKCDKIAPIARKVADSGLDDGQTGAAIDTETQRCVAAKDAGGEKPPGGGTHVKPKDTGPKDTGPKDTGPKDTGPKDNPPPFDEEKHKGLVSEARQAYLDGQYGVAIKKADEALGMKADDGALLTGGLSACRLKNAGKAKSYAGRLPAAKRNTLKQFCADQGVDIQ
jgi:pSer/pThr/pTyr-binding forkhead associated (FHA) protein